MIIVAAQIELISGRLEENENTILGAYAEAEEASADVLFFPELTLTGYPLGDLPMYTEFLQAQDEALERVIAQAPQNMAVGLGYIAPEEDTGILINRYSIFYNGEALHTQDRTLISQSEIAEGTYTKAPIRPWNYKDTAFTIEAFPDLIDTPPALQSANQQPAHRVVVSTPLYVKGSPEKQQVLLQQVAEKSGTSVSFISAIGSADDMLFAGGSFCADAKGNVILAAPIFEEALLFFHPQEAGTWEPKEETSPYEKLHRALTYGLRSYLHKSGFSCVNLGLSGGIDSALVAALAVDALGPDQVHGYLMPSPYSSEGSITDSIALAKNLGISYHIVPITPLLEEARATLAPSIGVANDLTEENLQARIRGLLLMGHSNRTGSMLLATGNKSEFAVGYSTLYGDTCGGLAPIGDLYKTEVIEFCKYLNRDEEVIPENIITKPPSAELRPDQKDEDSLPPYPILDDLLYHYIERLHSKKALAEQGFAEETIEKVVALIRNSEYKRRQAPPVLRVSIRNFGSGRNIPIIT